MDVIASPSGCFDDVRQISDCMIGARGSRNLAHEVVLAIELQLMRQGWPVGRALGPLPQVQKGLGLGRPACREAITVLEARGLLDVRRGPGGGLFVAAPALEDVAGVMLMYLALTGASYACIADFRLLVWRMTVETAIVAGADPATDAAGGEWGFAVDLADRTGNATIAMIARLAEMLSRLATDQAVPARDPALERAMRTGNVARAFDRLDALSDAGGDDPSVIALEVAERGLALSGRKSAMALAARMARELGQRTDAPEAEWQTAERLGYTEAVVRQARRILQDLGMVRCSQGRKGAAFVPPSGPAAVIRMLVPCLMAAGGSARDNREAVSSLADAAPALAARRVREGGGAAVRHIAISPGHDRVDVLALENLLLDLSGNPLLAIMVRSLGLANLFIDDVPPAMPDQGEMIAFNRTLLQVIEAGDVPATRAIAQAKAQAMRRSADGYRKVA